MKRLLSIAILSAALVLPTAAPALAADPGTQGQPSQNCQTIGVMPPGFNTAGFAHAGTVYAGSQSNNSNNPKSVSQYDVACFQVSQH